MTERDYYVALLQKMIKIGDNLQKAIDQLNNFKIQLNNGITINNIRYKDNDIEDLYNNVSNQLRNINDFIIPGIRNKLETIED